MRVARTIAIDGPAGSGKSTIGARLAQRLGYVFVDAGALYRTITGEVLARGVDIHEAAAVIEIARQVTIDVGQGEVLLDGSTIPFDLHSHAINQAVPVVAAYPDVRNCVRQIQQKIAQNDGIVFSGRDIGTVVLPHADLKIYLNPSLQERASRRHATNPTVDRQRILEDLQQRDSMDTSRAESPLRIAEDAIVVATDGMEIDDVLELLLSYTQSTP